MQIVIDIPEAVLNRICFTETYPLDMVIVCNAIHEHIKLPKGHGRLIDADRTIATAWTNFYKHEDEWEKKDNDYLPIGRIYDQNGFDCCLQTIVNAPTIIEAAQDATEATEEMTKEEALAILDTIPTIGEQVDALEMAIEALKREPVLDKIRAEINSPNRGTCDYFIVDRIEEIINKYIEADKEVDDN